MFLVRSGAAAGLERLVSRSGGNPIDIMKDAGLRQAQFRDPDTYIAYHKLAELLELCANRCHAPLFGLQLAQGQTTSSALGELPLIASREGTVGEALTSVGKFLYLHASGVHVNQEPRGSRTRLILTMDLSSHLGIDQLLQLSVAHLATFTAGLLNADRFGMALHLRQPPPTAATPGTDLQFRRVTFGAEFDGIAIQNRQLDRITYRDEAALNEHIRNYLSQLQNRYPDNLENQVKDVIGRLLPTGECNLDQVAATLDLHPRTLQIRLGENGRTYGAILQETRRRLAEHHLRYRTMSITDLALQLGYAEAAVLSRHFKRWTGVSPRQWQKLHPVRSRVVREQ